jgi:hypothetical protein
VGEGGGGGHAPALLLSLPGVGGSKQLPLPQQRKQQSWRSSMMVSSIFLLWRDRTFLLLILVLVL